MSFEYKRFIHFYDTDAMGVVHHANYIRLFEEARVAMMREKGMMKHHHPATDFVIAVLETACRHHRPAYFEDEVRVETEVRMVGGVRIQFQYRVFSPRFTEPIADGMSLHILIDSNFKVRKLPAEMRDVIEREQWTETWRSNL